VGVGFFTPAASPQPILDIWRHFAVSYNRTSGVYQLFVDGVRTGSEVGGRSRTEPGESQWIIGHSESLSALSDAFAGALDDVRMYNRQLSGKDIAALYALAPALAPRIVSSPKNLIAAAGTPLNLSVVVEGNDEPTSSASLPNLVDDDDLGEANVLMGASWGTMLAVGAAIGGLVAATFGRDVAFVVNAASFAVSGYLIVGITRPLKRRAQDGGDHHQLPHGGLRGVGESIAIVLRFARGNRRLAALLLSKTTFGVGTGVIVMLAVFGRDVFGAGDAGIGVLFAARGLGALIGPFLARSIVGLSDRGLLLGIGVSFLAFATGYSLLPFSPALWVASIAVFVAHLGGGAQWMLSTYGLQRASPDEIRGRVFSFDYGLVTVTIAMSMLVAGFLAERLEPAVTTWILVALAAIAAAGWLALARPLIRRPSPTPPTVAERTSSD
jgi:MFS family permease